MSIRFSRTSSAEYSRIASPSLQAPDWFSNTDFFVKLAGGLAMLWAFLKWLLLPLVKAGLKELLKEELSELRTAARDIGKCSEQWSDMDVDLGFLEDEVHNLNINVHANREWMSEFSLVLDNILGIERRKQGDASKLPDLPPLPAPRARRSYRRPPPERER